MRYIQMNDELYEYVTTHSNPGDDPVAARLAELTRERFADQAGMNIGQDQGRFLATLVAISGARHVVEVGTFTGMSALWMARALPDEPHVDLAFIDADKPGYQTYLDLLLPRLSDRGLIVVDNVLWSGAVVDDRVQDANTVALREFNNGVARRDDVHAVMLPVGDGVTLIRRR